MKKFFLSIFLTVSLSMNATSLSQFFCNMPDSVIPYLGHDISNQLIELKAIQPDSIATITTEMGILSLTRLTSNVLTLKLSDLVSMEIGKIDANRFIVIKTTGAPECESVCYLCDSLWRNRVVLDFSSLQFFADTASIEQRKLVEFPLIEVHFDYTEPQNIDNKPSLTLNLHAPMLNTEEKKNLNAVLLEKTLTWNGKEFK